MIYPTYVISLKDSTERRNEFNTNNSWMQFEFFDAIDAKNKHIPFIKDISKAFHHNDFSLGALGCLLSHRQLWKMLINSKHDAFLIFEDDVVVSKRGYNYWVNYININSNNNFDIVFLGAHDGKSIPDLGDIKKISILNGFLSRTFDETLFCAYGYIITKKGAKNLIKRTRINLPVDYWGHFNTKKDLFYYCIYPNILKHSKLASISNIQNSKSFEKFYFKYFYHAAKNNLKKYLCD